MIVSLTSAFIQNNLLCPDGQRRIEYVDRGGTGLYIEVRSTSPGQRCNTSLNRPNAPRPSMATASSSAWWGSTTVAMKSSMSR